MSERETNKSLEPDVRDIITLERDESMTEEEKKKLIEATFEKLAKLSEDIKSRQKKD